MTHNLVSDAIIEWFKSTPTHQLQIWAENQDDITEKLLVQYRLWIPVAGYFLRGLRTTIEAMTLEDYDAILRRALQDVPERGVICYLHRPWFYDQCATLQRAILAQWPKEDTHGNEHGPDHGDSHAGDKQETE